MSLPLGRILLRSAVGHPPPSRVLGSLSVSTQSTNPRRLRPARNLERHHAVAAGFHTVPAARRQENGDGSDGNNKSQNAAQNKKPTRDALAPTAGSFARIDESITVEYPAEHQLPSSMPVEGTDRAGAHVFPTLATFSLQGKVAVVTGGARGLGLVMGRKLSTSIAIIITTHLLVGVNEKTAA